jgi:hypothetical protein
LAHEGAAVDTVRVEEKYQRAFPKSVKSSQTSEIAAHDFGRRSLPLRSECSDVFRELIRSIRSVGLSLSDDCEWKFELRRSDRGNDGDSTFLVIVNVTIHRLVSDQRPGQQS